MVVMIAMIVIKVVEKEIVALQIMNAANATIEIIECPLGINLKRNDGIKNTAKSIEGDKF
jgi:predicted TIM-barrel enzyme